MLQKLYGSLPGIVVPNVVESLTTRRVLTMEWMDGTKLPWGDDVMLFYIYIILYFFWLWQAYLIHFFLCSIYRRSV